MGGGVIFHIDIPEFNLLGLTAFREHVTKHRNMDGDFSCKECGKKTNKWGHLMQVKIKSRHIFDRLRRCLGRI